MSWWRVTAEETEVREYVVEAMTESEARHQVEQGRADDSSFVEHVGIEVLRTEYDGPSTPFVVPADWPVQPVGVGAVLVPGQIVAQCGTCQLRWIDSEVTSLTPAPSGRCPFESVDGHR